MSQPAASTYPPPASRVAGRALPAWLCLGLVAATLAFYWPALHCDFINYDDPEYFTANPHVLGGWSPANVLWAFTSGQTGNWHPLTWLSLMLDVELFGPGPVGPHCTNVLLHCANAVLLLLLLRQLTGATWRSALVAALFAWHPLRVESVAWVSERKDVLSGFFFLLTLLAYSAYVAKLKPREMSPGAEMAAGPASRPRRWVLSPSACYALALGAFALGLMSKPMLVTLPFLLLLLDWWPLGRGAAHPGPRAGFWGLAVEKWPFFVLSAVSSVVTFIVQQKGGAVVTLVNISLGRRLENTFIAYVRYLGKVFWPAPLATPYPYPAHWEGGLVLYAVALIVGLCALAWLGARRCPFVFVGWFWFLGTLLPVIGLVQVGNQSLADRYTYLPVIGVFWALVWGAGALRVVGRLPRFLTGLLALALLVPLGLRARYQIGYWQNSGALFQHALDATENNFTAWNNLGTWLSNAGLVNDAVGCFRQSLRIQPDNPDALFNLGNACARLGEWDQAIRYYRRAREKAPGQLDVLNNLGFALASRNQLEEAITCFETALRLDPNSASTHNNLAAVLYRQHHWEEAVRHYREALRLVPGDPRICLNLSDALLQQGQPAEAVKVLKAALRRSPGDPQITARLQALGIAAWE